MKRSHHILRVIETL